MTTTGRPTRRRAGKPREILRPPPDNPLFRHNELNGDRRFGSEGKRLAGLRVEARQHALSLLAAEPIAPTTGISNWVQMGPMAIPNGQTYGGGRVQVTGRITAIAVDPSAPNTIYVGAAQGGIWKSTDGGQSWSPRTDNEVSLATGALALDPTNPQIVYVGTGEGNFAQDSYYGNGVLKSTDGGATWTSQARPVLDNARFMRLAINPATPTTVFACTSFGIYRTTNGGGAWTQMTNGLPPIGGPVFGATDVAIDPSNPSTLYPAFWGAGIYRPTNPNAANPSWTQLTTGLPAAGGAAPSGFMRVVLGVSPSSPQTIYALMCNND